MEIKDELLRGFFFTGLGKEITPERMKEAEKNVCQILPPCLKKAVTAKNGCSKVAKEISNTYFGGKSFDSSLLNFVNVSMLDGLICIRACHRQIRYSPSAL